MDTMDGRLNFLDTDFTKAFAGFAVPGFDAESVLASQRKNVEALTQANQLAAEGLQAVAKRQVEIAKRGDRRGHDAVARHHPADRSRRPHRQERRSCSSRPSRRASLNARELTLTLAKAQTEAFDVITKRVAEGFEEIRDTAKSRAAK
jgi:hypothetical protein